MHIHSTHILKHTVEKSYTNVTQYKDGRLPGTAQDAHPQYTLVRLVKAQTKLCPTNKQHSMKISVFWTLLRMIIQSFTLVRPLQTNWTLVNWSPRSHVAHLHRQLLRCRQTLWHSYRHAFAQLLTYSLANACSAVAQLQTDVCISCFCTDPSQFLSELARPTGHHQ